MKKSYIYTIVIFILLQACVKDKGNYQYVTLDDYTITGVDTYYYKDVNITPLVITPTIKDKNGTIMSDSDFTYTWEIYSNPDPPIPGRTIGTNKILEYIPTAIPGNVTASGMGTFFCYFRATNKKTNIFVEKKFTLVVGSDSYEGWLALTQTKDGNSRLSMISLKGKKDTVIRDILKVTSSTFPLDAPPVQIDCNYANDGYVNGGNVGIFIATERDAAYLELDSFHYSSLYDVNNYYFEFPNYKDFHFYTSDKQGIAWYGNQLIPYRKSDYSFFDDPIESTNGNILNVSRFVALNKGKTTNGLPPCIVYDLDNHAFLRIADLADAKSAQSIPDTTLFKFQDSSKTLAYMDYTPYNSGKVIAILKTNTNNDFYVARFSTEGTQEVYTKIKSSNIANAKLFAIDPTYGYIFYVTNDNTLYEYDPIENTETLMAQYGSNKVSLLQYTFIPGAESNSRYNELNTKLSVCTYNESDVENSGVFHLYNVNGLHSPLTENKTYSGLGKIVSLTYRSR